MFRFITVFMFMTMLCLPAFAEEKDPLKKELRASGQITDSDARLKSYDAVLEKYALRKKAEKKAEENKWAVDVKADPLDDSKVIMISNRAEDGDWLSRPTALVIRKEKDGLELYVCWSKYLGSEALVTMRVGKDEAETSQWAVSTDSHATFFPGSATDLLARMLKADQFVVRCTPYSESPVTVVFDIRGLRKELEKYKGDFAAVLAPPQTESAASPAPSPESSVN